MTGNIKGVIVNYRTGIRTQKSKESLVQFAHVHSASDAARLVGRKVSWKNGKVKIIGKIVKVHGGKGTVVARFRRGVPGQAHGTDVELSG